MRIKFTSLSPEWPWARYSPGGLGRWDDAQFICEEHGAPGDWWVVFDDLPAEETAQIPAGQTLLITPEPPTFKTYKKDFAAQFDWVLTSHRQLDHPGKVYGFQAMPWFVGHKYEAGRYVSFSKDHDQLKPLWPIPKTKLVSVIASDKTFTAGHRARRDFVLRLQNHFGGRLEVFGRGGREIPDKWDGIASFRYHIAIENSATPDYWTEKVTDAFLAGAFPIYHGAPNIHDYFPKESLAIIDINDPKKALEQIEQILACDDINIDALKKARDLVLEKYSPFPTITNFCAARTKTVASISKTLRPSSAFKGSNGIVRLGQKLKRSILKRAFAC